jgi:glucosylceramidase
MAVLLSKHGMSYAALFSALFFQGCSAVSVNTQTEVAEAWTTAGDQMTSFEKIESIYWVDPKSRSKGVELTLESANPMPFYGVGAAVTHASAWLINNAEDPDVLFEYLFSMEKGAGIDIVRIPIGSSDFPAPNEEGKVKHTSFNDLDLFEEDKTLEKFSIAEDERTIIPVLQRALSINPELKIMAAPWSPPGWMKDSQSMRSGRLKVEYYGVYADYLIKFLKAYQEQGITVDYLSLQNEPHHTSGNYPTNIMLAVEQAMFVNQFLQPKLAQNDLQVQLVLWDHNAGNFNAKAYEELAKYPIEVLDALGEEARSRSIVGFHCYESDGIDSLSVAYKKVQTAYPNVEVHNTECSGGGWAPNYQANLDWYMKTLYVGTALNGGSSVIYWNAVLDSNDGPKLGGCHNCRGLLTVKDDGAINKELEWYITAHIGKFSHDNNGNGMKAFPLKANFSSGVQGVVFENQDGSRFAVLHNGNNERTNFSIDLKQQKVSGSVLAHSVTTISLN